MINSRSRKILEFISSGKISAEQGDKLLAAISDKKLEKNFKIMIISSQQDVPVFEFAIPLSKIGFLKNFIKMMDKSSFSGKIQLGAFKLDLSKINWQRIFELSEQKNTNELLILEMPASRNIDMTFKILID